MTDRLSMTDAQRDETWDEVERLHGVARRPKRGLTFDEIAAADPETLDFSQRAIYDNLDLARDGFRAGQEMARQVMQRRAAELRASEQDPEGGWPPREVFHVR